ncbi:MAG: DUF1122 domain-containing protein [Gammaproteobacteria bacterium]|nr:DUF1122 domain-containing protein [Gammaproteobacteria bacterium]NIR84016.1 DUF1122 domain-containing protein [Gammaproteobacteria bacterium]NIR89160.1 DUF1122 domain-containing protein [Gammaproteobacteria bacterium]NIU04962.1 DUF1122 domain-containing protein [Gammaproteobacteria bacterium]NIV52128.1 DUF1122 domain-containing protein [Gammaproteobacteria bacterium]
MERPTFEEGHVLSGLHGALLGEYRLKLDPLQRERKSGWVRFRVRLTDARGAVTDPVLDGVHSRGGRGVLPWIELLHYAPRIPSDDAALDLGEAGLDLPLFRALNDLLPPGGHIMVGCESADHQDTYRPLRKGVPPAATPLGALLFEAGFRKVKFFYLAEGGWEGQQKLWGEKPLDEAMRREWDRATARELERYLEESVYEPEVEQCLCLAGRLLEELRSHGRASVPG